MQAAGERRRSGAYPTTPPSLPAADRRRDPDGSIPDAQTAERALLDALAASGSARTGEAARSPRGPGLVLLAPALGLGLWALLLAWVFG